MDISAGKARYRGWVTSANRDCHSVTVHIMVELLNGYVININNALWKKKKATGSG